MFLQIANNKIIGINCLGYQEKGISYPISEIEVSREIYDDCLLNPDKYIYQNGKVVIDPDYEEKQKQKERERLNLLSLTKREVFLALYKAKGITPDAIKANIADNPEALIEFEYANEYFRGNPLIDVIGEKLGYTSEDLDHLFETGELPVKVEVLPDLDPDFGIEHDVNNSDADVENQENIESEKTLDDDVSELEL